jgi:hypothetical protein
VGRIASLIREELLLPHASVVFRQMKVVLAAVPEAPVDEHDDAGSREHQIASTTRCSADSSVDEEATPSPVQLAPK